MALALGAIVVGLLVLVWSAGRFVDGAAAVASHFGMPPLLVGMVVVGFGTSAPELVVSLLSSLQGNPGIALGNAYGSNITNIALILGVTALVSPIAVQSQALKRELPSLVGATVLTAVLLWDGMLSRTDAWILLGVFALLMGWSIREGLRKGPDTLGDAFDKELHTKPGSLRLSVFWLVLGLLLLVASSRLLVWGAVEVARSFGVSDLVIGLTIVAIGTSLPELASSLIAARKGEHDIAFGNVLGSNLFNTLAVVGIAGAVSPMKFGSEVLERDVFAMGGLTMSLFVLGYGFRGRPGRINRFEGALLLCCFVAYTAFLLKSEFIR